MSAPPTFLKERMGALRKLRKSIKKESEPMILFVPNTSDIYDKFISNSPDVITVTDPKIYAKVKEAVMQAIDQNRPGVIRKS